MWVVNLKGGKEVISKSAGRDLRSELDAKDAARYRWLRAQHWIENTVSVVATKSVIPGSDCPSYGRLDEWVDRIDGIEL